MTMQLFENTRIAFEYKNNQEIKKAYVLFKLVGSPLIVKMSKVMVNISLFLKIPIAWAIKPTIYAHFCGGETIDESSKVIRKLEPYRVRAILDYSVEGKESEEDIQAALDETLQTIRNAGSDTNIPFAVFKPTAMTTAETLEKMSSGAHITDENILEEADKFRNRVDTLCHEAYNYDIPILIDAEDSWYQNFIDQVCEEMMVRYNKDKVIVFNTLQMYRNDRLRYLEKAYNRAVEGNYYLGIKFVRGAYMEKERERATQMGYPDPINPTKEATDKMYDDGLRFTMDHLDRIVVFSGSHNEASNLLLTELIEAGGLERSDNRVWFSQLFGMSDNISFNLAKEGYNVAKYLPYGPVKHVLPYLIRRAEENTSVAGQTSRELELVKHEIIRRRHE